MSGFIDQAEPVLDESREEMLRKQAIAAGSKTYFTGEPCIWGHVAPRYVSNSRCTNCRQMSQARKAETEGRLFKTRRKRLARNVGSSFGMAAGKPSWA